jgi:hypothetical protein
MKPTAASTVKRFDDILERLKHAKTVEPLRVVPQRVYNGRLDVPGYCSAFSIEILKTKDGPSGGDTMYCLKHCIFDPNHTPNEASIIQQASGRLLYQCFHNSCSGRTWADARRQISGEQSLVPWMLGGNVHHPLAKSAPIDDSERGATPVEDVTPPAPDDQALIKALNFEFIHNADVVANLRPTEWRIHGVLTDYALYYNFGDPCSFKTFVEIDRLLHIASGLDYHGHKVKQGTVFYICGEGFQGVGRRILAWHNAHNTQAKDIPFFISKGPTQLTNLKAVLEVQETVDLLAKQFGPPAVVHLDTLARNFGEGDENSTADMNTAIANLDKAFGTDFCRGLTHHTGHGNKDRARGSMALHGAADAAFRISITDPGQVFVECKKLKDAPSPKPMLFNRREILLQIGNEQDRSFVLDLVAKGDDAIAVAKQNQVGSLKGGLKKSLEILRQLSKCYPDNGHGVIHVPYYEWMRECCRMGLYKRSDAFSVAAGKLFTRKIVTKDRETNSVFLTEMIKDYEQ